MGGEFQVNTTSADNQDWPRVAMARDGRCVVAWQSRMESGQSSPTT
jgi:hypothetical protein